MQGNKTKCILLTNSHEDQPQCDSDFFKWLFL